MNNYPENSVNGGIPLKNVARKNVDISKYLDLGFCGKFWFKDNAGLSPCEPGSCLGKSQRAGRLMCYQILTHIGKVIS